MTPQEQSVSVEPVAWLITGCKIFRDSAVIESESADRRISERGNTGARKEPLYSAAQLKEVELRAYERAAMECDALADSRCMDDGEYAFADAIRKLAEDERKAA